MNREADPSEPKEPFRVDAPTVDGIGLALSGGGFRATLFHLGALWRLNELGLLSRIDLISSVSGGAIVAGLLAARWSRLCFNRDVAQNFQEEVAQPTWNFCSRTIDIPTAIFSPILPGINLLEHFYRRHLVAGVTLQDIPDEPSFIFNAAHLETGRNWTFSKSVMRTYRLGIIERPVVPLSKVIAASSAFPPAFPPVTIKLDADLFKKSEYADLYDEQRLKRKVSLTDGGVYDNLGVHAIRDCDVLLVSDASGPLEVNGGASLFRWLSNRSKRPLDIAIEQTRALRRHRLVEELQRNKRGAFWTISTRVGDYPIQVPFKISDSWHLAPRAMKTRLRRLPDEDKAQLINWGYIQCDMSVRSHFCKDATPPKRLPYSEFI